MGRTGTIPWAEIKNAYVIGIDIEGKRVYPTIRELVEKYHVAISNIGTKCKREDWLSERQIYANKIETKQKQKQVEQISNKGVDFDLECFKQAQSIRKLIEGKIDNSLKPQEIAMLVKALKDNQAYAKEALGEVTVDDQQKIVIEIVK